MLWYRLVFRDGTVSAWEKDYEKIKKSAEFFRATIETKKGGYNG